MELPAAPDRRQNRGSDGGLHGGAETSEVAPLNAFILARIMHEAGVPAGVFNLITGYGPVVGRRWPPSRRGHGFLHRIDPCRRPCFLNLPRRRSKRVALSLGGKSAGIVLDDADFATAVPAVVANCYANAGQTCTAQRASGAAQPRGSRSMATATAESPSASVIPSDGTTPRSARLRPASSSRLRDALPAQVAEGAELLTGGSDLPMETNPAGYFVGPTVFGNVDPASAIAQEEVFGPVLSIIAYDDEEDAIHCQRHAPRPCGRGLVGSDERAERVARRLRTGQVEINGGTSTSRRRSAATNNPAMAANWDVTGSRNSSNTRRCSSRCAEAPLSAPQRSCISSSWLPCCFISTRPREAHAEQGVMAGRRELKGNDGVDLTQHDAANLRCRIRHVRAQACRRLHGDRAPALPDVPRRSASLRLSAIPVAPVSTFHGACLAPVDGRSPSHGGRGHLPATAPSAPSLADASFRAIPLACTSACVGVSDSKRTPSGASSPGRRCGHCAACPVRFPAVRSWGRWQATQTAKAELIRHQVHQDQAQPSPHQCSLAVDAWCQQEGDVAPAEQAEA